jgi:hypothetical protein
MLSTLIYWWDRALRNVRDCIPREYEIPRYTVLKPDGAVDYEARWPGWDGWYFFVIPDQKDLPVKMIRGSLMTGLYGLEGIDNYDRLLLRMSERDAAEFLCLVPTAVRTPAGIEKRSNLSQHYLPKKFDLRMAPDKLDIAMAGEDVSDDDTFLQYGRIAGSWPNYQIAFRQPEADIRIELTYRGEDLVWWADFPGIFTYFAAFGRFEGTLTYRQGTSKENPNDIPENPETYAISGRGAFEHGFARALLSADPLFLPFRLITQAIPSFRPIRYQYELLIGDDNLHGGFMQASALGIKVRDHGGLYLDGRYIPVRGIRITYHEDPPPDVVAAHCPDRPDTTFYRRWTVQARTAEGDLVYTGTREWPPAPVAPSMTYYHFSYEGTFRGSAISGRGYGEYVHL